MTSDIGAQVVFEFGSFQIQDPIKGWMIGSGRRIANLYVLDLAASSSVISTYASSFANNVVDASVWHQRFGHSSFERI